MREQRLLLPCDPMDPASIFLSFLRETWWLTAEMAPYLLFGFLMAGILKIFFTEKWIRRHLGKSGLRQIVKAVVIGIPLPLCSCGVIPVAAGIRRQGGQRGAVAAFTAATPQTGVDAIAATVGMLGWAFALIRVGIAFINGIVAGLVVERWGERSTEIGSPSPEEGGSSPLDDRESSGCCGENEEEESTCCSSDHDQKPAKSCCSGDDDSTGEHSPPAPAAALLSGFRFGFFTLPRDLFGALVVGLLLAGLIGTFVQQNFFSSIPGGQFGVYLGMTIISLPLYVCSTGSIPMAFTFLQAGMSPGAVLLFLIAGPATNMATVTSLWKLIGPRGTLGYILSIIGTSWIVAIAMDFSGLSLFVGRSVHEHSMELNLFQQGMGILLITVLIVSKVSTRFAKSA